MTNTHRNMLWLFLGWIEIGLLVTYMVLYVASILGTHALFLGGAVVGGFWGNIWNMILFFDEHKIDKSYSTFLYVFLVAILGVMLIVFYFVMPIQPID